MELMQAFDVMLGSLTAADASRRQVGGCAAWQTQVAAAVSACEAYLQAAIEALDPAAGQVHGHETPTHRSWLDLCLAIIAALAQQAELALIAHVRWVDEAGKHRAAAEHWRAAAAACDEEENPGCRAHCLAMAAAEDAEAARCEHIAHLAHLWQLAAEQAAQAGRQLAAAEDRIHRPVGEAIAAAGGTGEVARAKTYHVAGSSR